jgi:hypothetical protein
MQLAAARREHGGGSLAASASEGELVELRRKFAMLESDRRAYYEHSMRTMKDNKAAIGMLREGCKRLREELKAARTRNANEARMGAAPVCSGDDSSCGGGGGGVDVDKLEKHVSIIRRNLDTVCAQVERGRLELARLRDQGHELVAAAGESHEAEAGGGGSTLTPAQAKAIRRLENRLDRSMIKFNEAQSIRQTYEQIAARLREERDGFDAQLTAMEQTMRAKGKDVEELALLSGDAALAKDAAMRDLAGAQERLDRERKRRQRELSRKQQMAEAARSALAAIAPRKRLHDGKRRDEAEQQQQQQQQQPQPQPQSQQHLPLSEEAAAAEASYALAYRKLLGVAGVGALDELIDKIVTAGETCKSLRKLADENTSKIEELQDDADLRSRALAQARLMGRMPASAPPTRKRADDLEGRLDRAQSICDSRRRKSEQAAELLVQLRAGILHIHERMQGSERADGTTQPQPPWQQQQQQVPQQPPPQQQALPQQQQQVPQQPPQQQQAPSQQQAARQQPQDLLRISGIAALGTDMLHEALKQCEAVMVEMMRRLSDQRQAAASRFAHHHQLPRSLTEVRGKLLSVELAMQPRAMAFNQRVRLTNEAVEDALEQIDRNARGGSAAAGTASEFKDDDAADSDEDDRGTHLHSNDASMPVSRAQLKLASQIIVRHKRKPEPDEEPLEQPHHAAAPKPHRSIVEEAGAKPREGRLATRFAASTKQPQQR